MPGRPHSERLIVELDTIRRELIEVVCPIPLEELDWSPQPDMKSYRNILLEIGATEWVTINLLRSGQNTLWDEAWGKVERGAETHGSLLASLDAIRSEFLEYLAGVNEEQLQIPIPCPPEWRFAFGGVEEIEPEELVREIARHEYYHLGQLITYRWIQGHNPYQSHD